MEKDSIFCCPYTQKDCSCSLRNHTEARFSINFYFANNYPPAKFTKCTTGGALIIHGTEENYYGECIDVYGFSTVASLEDEEDMFLLQCP
ncbi:hypothetical protein INT48_004121 [Thamnidium elegans]|uniref:Uncharacterized protein n=1 Tax=Thamnidium elegans TaxID=101142 RepID=A0A8H7VXE2_9FUNG|nr:hypothetical protein INT48_004121 [Thamnidium elegans]